MNFREQVAVITGAASGIGLALAKQLFAYDARLVLLDINKELLEREFAHIPERALLFSLDIT
ncbi:MAG TPA: SDR family NAD(P)-dependent oxidoreductase, partial [Chitinophagaceae bacterium]|nr:SDR family NAD(P)-dependent oxidoreductase [Chitinophagaceae bacterium]